MNPIALLSVAAALLAVAFIQPAVAESRTAPRRVVSINVCTDQLAMLIAAPGQLVSVSHLSRDDAFSAMTARARAMPVNHGRAEEIFLLDPDLVLASTFTARATVSLLTRLGIRVEEFTPEATIDDIRRNIVRMGELLGREARALAILQELDAVIAGHPPPDGEKPTAAPYYANSYTAGAGVLVSDLIRRAGFANLAERLGLSGTARLPLETLIMAAPDSLVLAERQPGAMARAQDILQHPALARAFPDAARVSIPSRYTNCGTPFVAEALDLLVEHRRGLPVR